MMIDTASGLIGWQAGLPTLIVTGTALLVMIVDLLLDDETDRGILAAVGILGLGGMVASAIWLGGGGVLDGFGGQLRADGFGLCAATIVALAAAGALLLSVEFVREQAIAAGDYYVLVLLATAGMVAMVMANDLLVVFVALEVMSLAVYVLAGMLDDDRSIEASLKYFLLGAFASGFLLYGIAFYYGAFGTTSLDALGRAADGDASIMLHLGVGFLLVGLAFKVALMPFHAWTPDVYEGAPTPVTTLMAVGVKTASFAALARVFMGVFGADLAAEWRDVLWMLAVLTMTAGNLAALTQESVKRMLAYSSIAHAGYAMIGVVVGTSAGMSALLFYLLVYGLMNMGAFGVLIALGRRGEPGERYADFAGVGVRHPVLAAAMALFVLSLAGMPPTAGFAGKFQLFGVAVREGYVWLAVIGVLNSLLSIYYYLAVVMAMYMTEGDREIVPLGRRPLLVSAIVIAAVGTMVIGIVPSWPLAITAAAQLG